MKCKNTILNEMVLNSAEVMESHLEMNECIIEQLKHRPDKTSTVLKLIEINKRTREAIDLIREYAGCWA